VEYDLKSAKALLDASGHADGFTLQTVGQANNRQILEAIQASWGEIGVTLELSFPPGTGVTEALFLNPTVPLGTTNLTPDRDPSAFMSRMLSPTSSRNPGKVENPQVTELLADSSGIADEKEREATLREASALLAENVEALMPLVWRYDTIAYGDQVVGMQQWRGGFPVLDGVGIAAE
jgi:ABC-type transport system substrate-binding protein